MQKMHHFSHLFRNFARNNQFRTLKRDVNERLQRSITLHNDLDEVTQMSAFVDEVCESAGLDMSLTMSLNLAIEEAVVNVMSYAYPEGSVGELVIGAECDGTNLSFVITDWGTPFDPTAKEDADTTLSAEERPIGGLGIHLIREIMDEIRYERVDGKNVLKLRKSLVREN
jgi:sigma-B regulation protein RsbU (phosphoserine phosphatase)